MHGNILIIEDEKELSDIVAIYLGKEGFEVRAAETAEEGFALVESWKPELVILDINLPGMDGFEFLLRFRRDYDVPVMIVSARDGDEDLIAGLGGGADEFVTKPFSPRVLAARVRALFRRVRNIDGADAVRFCRFGPFTLDYDSCILKKDGEKILLSTKEYGCLAFLSRNPGKPLSPETIYAGVWKNNYGDITAVAVYIQRLRKKIEEDSANPVYIETVYGMGYRFNGGEAGAP
ncbi:MAG: response regulator transcription factor [Spirochaetaceae bacterium]|jgi:two-component system response regulator RegX3|nr:response regulator transcription factor [Spirochaetaceae bacterium]